MALSSALRRTALYEAHRSLGARMVPFAGWEMPLQFSSILAEARAVREAAGMFDVSHMGRLRFQGPGATALLDRLLTGDIGGLKVGRARYGFLLTEAGGILDDTITYRLGEERYLLVCNAANREAVREWARRWMEEGVSLEDVTEETVMVAVQGPRAVESLEGALRGWDLPLPPSALRPFGVAEGSVGGWPTLVARTGYTGEDGCEVIAPAEEGPALWGRLREMGVVPCGLGARDVLRLEAGLMLHGVDITPEVTPLEAGLERFVSFDKEFIGKEALQRQREEGVRRRLVGFTVEGGTVPRHGYPLRADGRPVGEVTSGAPSVVLGRPIGMGFVETPYASPGQGLEMEAREKRVPAQVVPLPFYSRRR